MHATEDEPMMKLTRTNRPFSSHALYALGALLCICVSLGVYSITAASVNNDFSDSPELGTEATSSPDGEPGKPTMLEAPVHFRGAMRSKNSPPQPAYLPPERFAGLSLNSAQAPSNNIADIRSLIFLSPLQNRAPPRFA